VIIPAIEEEVSKIQPLEVEPYIKLMGKEVKIAKPEVGKKGVMLRGLDDYMVWMNKASRIRTTQGTLQV
jgi:hypothetical protein